MKITKIALVFTIMLTMAACAKHRPEANEWGCTFGKGPLDNFELKGEYSPGSSQGWSNDTFKTGPSDVRFYIVDSDPATADVGGRPIVVPAKGTSDSDVGVVQVSVETQVRFVFNERFCDWYIQHGSRAEPLNFDATATEMAQGEESGWATFLNSTLNQKLIEAARPVVAGERYDDLYVNALIEVGEDEGLAYDVLADRLSTNLSRELKADLGDEYFCGPAYEFDGTIDNVLENGCPPLEVTIKRVVPENTALIQRLEAIVDNEEAQKQIESDKQRKLVEIDAQKQQDLAATSAAEETQLAEQARREAVETAKASADLAIQREQEAVFAQELKNQTLAAEADAAFCAELAEQGTRCDLYQAAISGAYPRIVLGDSTGTNVLLDVGAP